MTQLDLQQRLDREEKERRIAACVGAFDGIPTERIEGKDLGQILAGELRLHSAGSRGDGGFGFEFSGGVCQLMAEAYADQFKQSGAINYLELLFDHTEIGPLTITMQRVEGLTPAQKLAQAEAERDALQQQVDALTDENEYIRKRFEEADIICGKLILAMRSAVIEAEHGEGTNAGMDWIFNTLHGPGDLPPEDEKDAQKYFDREVAPLNKKLDELIDWFVARNKRLQAARLRQPEDKGQ